MASAAFGQYVSDGETLTWHRIGAALILGLGIAFLYALSKGYCSQWRTAFGSSSSVSIVEHAVLPVVATAAVMKTEFLRSDVWMAMPIYLLCLVMLADPYGSIRDLVAKRQREHPATPAAGSLFLAVPPRSRIDMLPADLFIVGIWAVLLYGLHG
jgi:hypothetical protein